MDDIEFPATKYEKAHHQMFYFELMWCYALKTEWMSAIKYAELVRKGTAHSPSFTTYAEAVFRYAEYIDRKDPKMKEKAFELFRCVNLVMMLVFSFVFGRAVPSLRIRHLGKTITPEKVAIVISEKMAKTDEKLVLLELVSC